MVERTPKNLGVTPFDVPARAQMPSLAIFCCRTLTDSRRATSPRSGSASSALDCMAIGGGRRSQKAIRNYLNGEMTYRDYTASVESDTDESRSPHLLPSRQRQKPVKPTPAEGTGSAEEAGK